MSEVTSQKEQPLPIREEEQFAKSEDTMSNIKAFELLKQNLHKLNWQYLSSEAVKILDKNLDKIKWHHLSETL